MENPQVDLLEAANQEIQDGPPMAQAFAYLQRRADKCPVAFVTLKVSKSPEDAVAIAMRQYARMADKRLKMMLEHAEVCAPPVLVTKPGEIVSPKRSWWGRLFQ